ncbi:hypothetical protein CKA32_005096 [Geitlerinema sp. FC II]|nr:hypothetical protein CKA32_005096 [Geitlerinema sp. FC II]
MAEVRNLKEQKVNLERLEETESNDRTGQLDPSLRLILARNPASLRYRVAGLP